MPVFRMPPSIFFHLYYYLLNILLQIDSFFLNLSAYNNLMHTSGMHIIHQDNNALKVSNDN